ncbi:MAG: hypothetical protein HW389_526 [Bacteroidetes bacterium]|nr:hypothetical protein [Bacteroidota bacterium]
MQRKLLILLLVALPFALRAQHVRPASSISFRHSSDIRLASSDTAYSLPHTLVVQGSEEIVLDSLRLLRRGSDYEIQYFRGVVSFRRDHLAIILADSSFHSIRVTYEVLPYALKREYSLRQVTTSSDSAGRLTRKVESSLTRFSMDDIFGSSLQKSGSLFRGLTLGSNRDLTLNSGFRMQLAGKLLSDLDIVAALTDENVPIQPEGTTQTLQELDKVFIQLRSLRYGATLGDFVYNLREEDGGEFGQLSRKLQGGNATATLQDVLGRGNSLAIGITGGTSRGTYTSNQIQGVEGSQGPYRLTGRDASRRPVVIAGTERVYIDGQLMTRGETNDYTIDYSTGEVFFSARRLITHATRITVDFEYADRQFTRNLVGASARVSAFDNRLHLFTSVTQEADDPGSPIDVALDDSLRALISGSGTERYKATVSGLLYAGRDSITLAGRGQYILKDTIVSGRHRPLLVYSPGHPQAYYSATFSFVDQMPADSIGYNRSNLGGYVAAGLGKGSYLPIQFLPIPELHRVINGRATFAPHSDVTISGDYAFSSYDENRLSSLDDDANQGGAYNISVEYHPKEIRIGNLMLGDLDLRASDRFVDRRFVSLDRAREIEFDRNWNISKLSAGDEEIRQAALMYKPVKSISMAATYGSLERKGSIRSSRLTMNASLSDSALPNMSHRWEYIQTEDQRSLNKSTWTRQQSTISHDVWRLKPGLRVEMEDRQDRSPLTDSLLTGSFRYLEIAPGLSLINLDPLRATAEIQLRMEDSASSGTMTRAFRAVTQLYDLQLKEWNSFSSSISLALRRTDLSAEFLDKGGSASNTILLRSQMRYVPWQRALDADALYEFSRERSAAMKRVFLRVSRGTGNYTYKGDLNQNGIGDENEFEQTRFDGEYVAMYLPSDQLVPVVDLRAGLRLRFTPARLFSQRQGFFEKTLAAISTETVARIEEKSTEPEARQIYFLHLSKFLNDSTTITGTNLFTQDLHVFEADPSFSLRFRFNQRNGLLRLLGYSRERGIRLRTQLLKEIGNQTEFKNKVDQLFSSIDSPRRRNLVSNALKTEFSYRPYPEWEVAFGTGLSEVINRFDGGDATADLNDQFLRLTYSILSLGQLRGEVQREEVQIAKGANAGVHEFPFEFTNGQVVGKTLLWRLAFEYRISQYIQVSVNYDGRSEGGRPAVHTARAEARAFF